MVAGTPAVPTASAEALAHLSTAATALMLLLAICTGSQRRSVDVAAVQATLACLAALILLDSELLMTCNAATVLVWIGASAGIAGLTMVAAAGLMSSAWVASRLRTRVAVFGGGAQAARLIGEIRHSDTLAFAGLFDDRRTPGRVDFHGIEYHGGCDALADLVRRGLVDRVVIALPASAGERLAQIVARVDEFPIDVHLLVQPADAPDRASTGQVSRIGSVDVALLHAAPLRDWGVVLKAIGDRFIAVLALVMLAPVFAIIAAAIKLDSPGPVFFRQQRHGICGTPIVVWKFRTMHVREDGPVVRQAMRSDPRVTRTGRILRKSSLNELPQLINVIMGSMSLVGPRPHAIAHNDYYGTRIASYIARNRVRPGITGWAQINGFRGETQTVEQMAQRVEHDIWYVTNWSFLLDLKILLLTPIYGLVHKNAY